MNKVSLLPLLRIKSLAGVLIILGFSSSIALANTTCRAPLCIVNKTTSTLVITNITVTGGGSGRYLGSLTVKPGEIFNFGITAPEGGGLAAITINQLLNGKILYPSLYVIGWSVEYGGGKYCESINPIAPKSGFSTTSNYTYPCTNYEKHPGTYGVGPDGGQGQSTLTITGP